MKPLTLTLGFLLITVSLSSQKLPPLESFFQIDQKRSVNAESQMSQSVLRQKNGTIPFFCRMENKWEKCSGHGVKFRLGDVRTVNRLEGKFNPLAIDQ